MGSFYYIQNLSSKLVHGIYTSIWPARQEINQSRRDAFIQQSRFSWLSTADQERYMLTALQSLVNYCRQEVPYYSDLLRALPANFPASFEEYRQLPPLDKQSLRLYGDSLIGQSNTKSNLIKYSTGGSTGEPVSVYITKTDHGIGEALNDIYMRQIGASAGNRIGSLYGGSLDVSAVPSFQRRIKNWLWNYSEHGCFRLDEKFLLEVHAALHRYRPDVLLGYASAIYLLAFTLKSKGIQPDYPRFSVLTAAEKLEHRQRVLIEDVFGVPVVERYGSRDAGLMAYQLPGDHRFWIDRWANLLEPEETPDSNGQATILITRLHVRGMPLLRYRIGDQAKFPSNWSPQHPAQWLDEISGRILDYIHLPEGRLIHGSEFPHLFKDYDVKLYQVRQEKNGNVTVTIVPGKTFSRNEREECEQTIRNNLANIHVTFQYGSDIERTQQNKLRPVISFYDPGN
jgi:phenylacetate-CoA ligase